MKLNELKRLAKLKHFNEFSKEELIYSFGLYDKALIDLAGIRFTECNNQMFEATALVSIDVEMLNSFLFDEDPIMLPCPSCGKRDAVLNTKPMYANGMLGKDGKPTIIDNPKRK